MIGFIYHLFLPHENNNYRSYILHHKNLFFVTLLLFLGTFLFSFVRVNFPSILGVSTDISSQTLLLLTNKIREENDLPPLSLDSQLSEAASRKADDMLAKNYWAHNSPDGTTPWVFIKNSGYDYAYAGENLARGFSNAEDVISAWMASTQHRANVLSQNYKDIGFAIKVGKLKGEETVLIVEEFGNRDAFVKTGKNIASSKVTVKSGSVLASPTLADGVQKRPLFESLPFSLNFNTLIISIFILALVLDMIVVERKKIVRLVGHNLDHVFFLLLILSLLHIISKGAII